MDLKEFFANYNYWLIPLILLLMVFTVLQDPITDIATGVGNFLMGLGTGGDVFAMATMIILFLVVLIGIGIALALNDEEIAWSSLVKRGGVLIVLLAMAMVINMKFAIISP
jgi:hypothetical protein